MQAAAGQEPEAVGHAGLYQPHLRALAAVHSLGVLYWKLVFVLIVGLGDRLGMFWDRLGMFEDRLGIVWGSDRTNEPRRHPKNPATIPS